MISRKLLFAAFVALVALGCALFVNVGMGEYVWLLLVGTAGSFVAGMVAGYIKMKRGNLQQSPGPHPD